MVSEEPLLPTDERDRDRGVDVREAMFVRLRSIVVVLPKGALLKRRRGVRAAKAGRRRADWRQSRCRQSAPMEDYCPSYHERGSEVVRSLAMHVLSEAAPVISNHGLGIRPHLRMDVSQPPANHLLRVSTSMMAMYCCLAL